MITKMQLLNLLLFSGVMGLLCSHLAKKRGKHPLIWFSMGFLFGIFGLILLYIVPTFSKQEVKRPAYKAPKPVERSDAWIRMWYYLDPMQKQVGPIEFPEFIDRVRSKKVEEETFVWSEGMKEWKKLSDLPDEVSKEIP